VSLTLILGNKNYSSWSMRPWIAMKMAGIPFEEVVISLDAPDFKDRVLTYSPAGQVPILLDDGTAVWESLSILEHLAERFPKAGLWPADPQMRSHARTVASEMHGGFMPLRRNCPMNIRRTVRPFEMPTDVAFNVQRIDSIWGECRNRFGQHGPFLFGAFCAADAMFAPVVSRFHSYAVPVCEMSQAYMTAMMELPCWKEWDAAARAEPWTLPRNEV
jgi:glutathione S-transferase